MELNPGKQLFIDDFFIESMQGARRVLNRPEKLTVDQPLEIHLDQPWEDVSAHHQRTVYIEDEQRFRLYYNSWIDERMLVCALDSADGLHWIKPSLGLVDFGGSTANNITNCPPGGLIIWWDPHEADLSRRWKRIDNKPTGTGDDGSPAWMVYVSADGYDWRALPPGAHSTQPMLFNFGAPASGFGGTIDPDAPYVFYSQRGSGRRTRVLGRRDSADFVNWSGLRTVIDQDLQDPPGTEFYAAGFDPANRTDGGLRTLMLHAFYTDVEEPYRIQGPAAYWGAEAGGPSALPARVDGFVDTQLAVSRDTVNWTRWREPFLERGAAGAWDWGMVYGDAPIVHKDRLYFFYGASAQSHNGRTSKPSEGRYPRLKSWGKGLCVLRPDGYVHVEAASFAPGLLTTHRFRQAAGGRVSVNADASSGYIRYELLEDTGAAIPGFGVADCNPIRADTLAGELSWQGVPGWPAVGEPKRRAGLEDLSDGEFYIKIRFHLEPGAKLYSLTLNPPGVAVWGVPVPGRID